MKRRAAVPMLLLAVLGCWPAPGVGPEAEAGYQRAAPIITALDRYHVDRGAYPAALLELAPEYLSQSNLAAAGGPDPQRALHYRSREQSYELDFWYEGPGSNTCTYTSEAKKWECRGAI